MTSTNELIKQLIQKQRGFAEQQMLARIADVFGGKRPTGVVIDDYYVFGSKREPPTAILFGMRVTTSPLCESEVPVRVHKERTRYVKFGSGIVTRVQVPAERGNYHNRIQKKWNKRYGFKKQYDMYIVGERDVMMHPESFAKIITEFGCHEPSTPSFNAR